MKISAVNSASGFSTEHPPAAVKAGATGEQELAGDQETTKVKNAIEILNQNAQDANRQTRFALYQDTHRIYVEVVDKDTNQVVSTYPPKQILQMAEILQQQAMNHYEIAGKEVK